jgi:hypothetical protein
LSYFQDIIDQHVGDREVVIVSEMENMYPAVKRLLKLFLLWLMSPAPAPLPDLDLASRSLLSAPN